MGTQNGDSARQGAPRPLRRAECRGQAGEKAWEKTGPPEDLMVHRGSFPRVLRPMRAERSKKDSPLRWWGPGWALLLMVRSLEFQMPPEGSFTHLESTK